MSQKLVLKQISALLLKNLKINLRNKIDVIREFVFPLIVIALIIVKKDVSFFPEILLPFYFPLTYIGLLRKIFIDLVLEKSEKYKETLKIMGLRQIAFTVSWLMTFYIIGILIEVVMMLTLYYGEIVNLTRSLPKLLLAYFLYMISAIHMSFCVTSLFSDPKKSIKLGSLILSVSCLVYFLVTYAYVPLWLSYVLSIVPQANVALTLMALQPNRQYNLRYDENVALGIQGFNVVFYFFLYWYLEETVQNQYGISKSKCFCFQEIFARFGKKKPNPSSQFEIMLNPATIHTEVNDPFQVAAIKISQLSKVFSPDIKAVDQLNLEIPKGQLFCLLGHNGAGKTTTINLLTGLIKATSGEIHINGLDFTLHLDRIRRSIGYCPQSDVLYDYLTVEEHIHLIEKIKGAPLNSSQSLLMKLQLNEHSKKYSKELSLGTKRKLSLALALICNSELIFLDEPTSGMDPSSRKIVWDLLLEMKAQKRSIIWTTHHLEEAEEIADKVGILHKGSLLISGTVNEVKREFGMGHILTISKKNKENAANMQEISGEMSKIIQKYRKNAKFVESQINDEFLKFLIPKEEKNLNEILKEIEEKYPFVQFSLDMNSLEDAFINIGIQHSPHLQNIWKDITNDKLNVDKKEKISFDNDGNRKGLFFKQVWAIFLHRVLLFIHDISSSIAIFIIHISYLLAIILICRYAILDYPDVSQQEKTEYISKLIVSSYILLSTLFLGHHVLEREIYVKYVMVVMGCKISAYWIGNFIFDFLMFIMSFIVMTIVVFACELYIFTEIYGNFSFVLIAFGLSLILFAYVISFIFRSYHAAAHFFPLIVFMTFAIPYLLIYLFEVGIYPNSKDQAFLARAIFQGIFLIFAPLYWVERGVSLLGGPSTESNIIQDSNIVAMVLIFQSVLWILILFALENRYLFNSQSLKRVNKQKKELLKNEKTGFLREILLEKKDEEKIPLMDFESIKQERESLLSFSPKDFLKIFNIHKKYKKNEEEVLKGIDFCVAENQVFALLGPNGAGKTTTFNILTSLIEQDSGLVLLDNNPSSLCDFYSLFQKVNVGLCPQFNGLWDNLTIREHIKIYGLLKGLKMSEIEQEYIDIMKELDLLSLEKTKAKNLSGGSKRKLSVAMAILGYPKIVFLDEPSTGIDPISKRLLWNLLKKRFLMRACCVILTTHSMNEAEFLGTKIGILIDGKFFTVNNLQAMKAKYSEGYRMILKVKAEGKETIRETIKEKFGEIEEEHHSKGDLAWIVREGDGFSFGETVKFLESIEDVQDYALSYCSLEEIFLKMVGRKEK